MNVTVNAQGLAAALKNNLAQKRSTLNIYEHVLLIATQSPAELRVISRDGSQEREVVIAAERVEQGGSVTCHAEKLQAAVTGLAGPATLSTEGSPGTEKFKTVLQQGRRRFQILSLSADIFPKGQAMGRAMTPVLDPQALAKAIATVQYAAAVNDVRFMLLGVHLNEGDVVAADGHRLACASVDADFKPITIPRDSLKNLIAALMEEGAELQYSDSAIEVTHAAGRYRSQLLDCQYVDYKRVMHIPETGVKATLDATHISPALSRLRSFVPVGTNMLGCMIEDNLLTLSAGDDSKNKGEPAAKDEAPATCQEKWPKVYMNLAYVNDAMHSIKGEFTWLNSGAHNAQVLWTGNQEIVHVLMPIRM
ncbi:DNA polymerase III subunit beta [Spongiibacter taiwanensis]|uniref:DNA polymerase III subunit beta n=1 Tax=Spongiibacter taiwanensis TaxID=1748242 RepID=UPI002034D8CD|nr:DNA polymerase III subunit beta [Spongiibacter taiwanensis]USA43353.1 DNA polymerase III subunit beta [Spongiibacter taiwanensis]